MVMIQKRWIGVFVCAVLVALLTGCNLTGADQSQATLGRNVVIEGGIIRGSVTDDGAVHIYEGIPYAASPVGDLRFRPPQAVVAWDSVRDTTEFSPACMQNPRAPDSFYGPGAEDVSEDCLFLNVWTAAASPAEKQPVMVWIHGGGLRNGHGGRATYDGEALARRGVVLVTINYRLGPFGFLAHPLLSAESVSLGGPDASGNQGLHDQIAALRWVQNNIGSFGGDPDRVTIFGESAGSWSVHFLQASPLAAGLFHGVIGESGTAWNTRPLRQATSEESSVGPRGGAPVEAAEVAGQRFVDALLEDDGGEPNLEAMRAASAQKILEVWKEPGVNFPSTGNVDGWFLPSSVAEIFAAGEQNDVPVITGWNADEGPSLVGDGGVHTAAEYRSMISGLYGELADDLLALYPANTDEQARESFLDSFGVSAFGQGARRWVRAMERVQSPAWSYYFERVPPGNQAERYGAYHAAEIAYVFGTLDSQERPWQERDRQLSDQMAAYWVSFARDGDPNEDGLPVWPTYTSADDETMVFGDATVVKKGVRRAELDFLDRARAADR